MIEASNIIKQSIKLTALLYVSVFLFAPKSILANEDIIINDYMFNEVSSEELLDLDKEYPSDVIFLDSNDSYNEETLQNVDILSIDPSILNSMAIDTTEVLVDSVDIVAEQIEVNRDLFDSEISKVPNMFEDISPTIVEDEYKIVEKIEGSIEQENLNEVELPKELSGLIEAQGDGISDETEEIKQNIVADEIIVDEIMEDDFANDLLSAEDNNPFEVKKEIIHDVVDGKSKENMIVKDIYVTKAIKGPIRPYKKPGAGVIRSSEELLVPNYKNSMTGYMQSECSDKIVSLERKVILLEREKELLRKKLVEFEGNYIENIIYKDR